MAKQAVSNKLLQSIGPGILMAGAAVGVSHLVQATRAGADYGLSLLWLLILACVSKYPFMEFGPRYASATGEHLIAGYQKMGRLYFWAFAVFTVATMFIIQAAVTIVTAGLAEQYFQLGLSSFTWCIIILGVCVGLLLLGKYPWLDKTMKVIITVLTICTLIAVIIAFTGQQNPSIDAHFSSQSYWTPTGIVFIIAMMGWMPIPIDASVWHSIWSKERVVQTKHQPNLQESLFDFNLGYLSAGFIGILFLLLGAFVMFGKGIEFSDSGVVFSGQLIDIYSTTLGEWSRPLIAIAALITMLSTTLAVSDAYPRVISEIYNHINTKQPKRNDQWKVYKFSSPAIAILSLFLLYFMAEHFTTLIDFATAMSFLSAPILAWFNFKLITGHHTPLAFRPGKGYKVFSVLCLSFLVIFSGLFIYLTWW